MRHRTCRLHQTNLLIMPDYTYHYKRMHGYIPCENNRCPSRTMCLRWLKYKHGAFWGGVFSCHKDADRCKHFVDKDTKDE